jgi:hypothetical protein
MCLFLRGEKKGNLISSKKVALINTVKDAEGMRGKLENY